MSESVVQVSQENYHCEKITSVAGPKGNCVISLACGHKRTCEWNCLSDPEWNSRRESGAWNCPHTIFCGGDCLLGPEEKKCWNELPMQVVCQECTEMLATLEEEN